MDIAIFVKVYKKVQSIEENLSQKFSIEAKSHQKIELENMAVTSEKGKVNIMAGTVEEIREKYKEIPKVEASEEYKEKIKAIPKAIPTFAVPQFKGLISCAFEPFLKDYGNAEELKLKDSIDKNPTPSKIEVLEYPLLNSSIFLFNNIKAALNRCLSISKGKPLLDLHHSFIKVFNHYTVSIRQILPRFQSQDKVKLTEKEEELLGAIINNCEYCLDTIKDLQNMILDSIEEKYQASVDLYQASNYFEDLIRDCFSIETSWIKNKMEMYYVNMYKINWGSLDKTGDTSGYAKGLAESFLSSSNIMQSTLTSNFYIVFVNDIIKFVPSSFLEHACKNKKVNEIAAQQLLLDLNEIKKHLSSLIEGKASTEPRTVERINSIINKEISKVELRFKVLGYPLDHIEEAYSMLIKDGSRNDFETMLLLKGARKGDLANYKLKFKQPHYSVILI